MLDKAITSYLPIIWSMFHIFPNICVAFYYAHVIPVRCMYPDSRIESDFAHCYFPPALILVLLVVVQSVSRVWLFVTSWTAAYQASLSFIISWSLLKLMYIELVMPPNHLVLYCPLLLLSSIFPSIRVFSNESVLHIRWPKYWSFRFSISPSNEYSGLISFRMD